MHRNELGEAPISVWRAAILGTATLAIAARASDSIHGGVGSRSNNPKSVVYVDDSGYRGVSCTLGSTCAATITIVDNDGITSPTEHPDWALEGSDLTFAGTSTNRPPTINGTESSNVRCLRGRDTVFRLLNRNGSPVWGAIEYSLRSDL